MAMTESQALPTRSIFFISDHTGITAETLGHTLLTQFDGVTFQEVSCTFVASESRAREVADLLRESAKETGKRPIVFSTLVDAALRGIIAQSGALVIDLFEWGIPALENELGMKAGHALGRSHGMGDVHRYHWRIEAVNFALAADDGGALERYSRADVILLGVSRSGKTPTCVYLAMHFGVLAANYPLMEEDLQSQNLPPEVMEHKKKLFGLTIEPARLAQIREQRLSGSRYASREQCEREMLLAKSLYQSLGIPFLDSTNRSIEELSATILAQAHLPRRF